MDLTQRPPRSARVRLGGFVILPRMLDKGRAHLAGKTGEYKFACPLDQEFISFVGIDPQKLLGLLKEGKGDGEILDWILTNAQHKRSSFEASSWSAYQEQRGPGEVEKREFFHELHKEYGPDRKDIITWFDLLDLDDYVSYGGKA